MTKIWRVYFQCFIDGVCLLSSVMKHFVSWLDHIKEKTWGFSFNSQGAPFKEHS